MSNKQAYKPGESHVFYAGLNPQQRETFKRLKRLLKRRQTTEACWHHDVGQALRDYRGGCTTRGRWFLSLMDALKVQVDSGDRSMLFRAMSIANQHTREELQDLQERGLTFGHIQELIRVRSDRRRKDLQERAVIKGWRLRHLREETYRKQYRPPQGERPIKFPKCDPLAGLYQLTRQTERWLAMYSDRWSDRSGSLLGQLQRQTSRPKQGKLSDQLGRTVKLLEDLRQAAADLGKALAQQFGQELQGRPTSR